MDQPRKQESDRFGIDPESVVAYRAQLRKMARGTPIAEAAVEGFSDWQVVEAMERLWAAGTSEPEPTAAELLIREPGRRTSR